MGAPSSSGLLSVNSSPLPHPSALTLTLYSAVLKPTPHHTHTHTLRFVVFLEHTHTHTHIHTQDIDQLTMFADYRVPVVLRTMGVLRYSQQLEDKVGH